MYSEVPPAFLGTVMPVFIFQDGEGRLCGSQGRAFNLPGIQEHKTKMKIHTYIHTIQYIHTCMRACTHTDRIRQK